MDANDAAATESYAPETAWGGGDAHALLEALTELRAELIAAEEHSAGRLADVHPNFRASAKNLLHYLALRRRDLRPLQARLAALGLSSLGRAEAHVLATIDAVLDVLRRLTGGSWETPPPKAELGFEDGQRLLAEHATALLGPPAAGRDVRIMVTMPSEAADDASLVRGLLEQGMELMRINCAHDAPADWGRMIERLRAAEAAVGRSCKVVMDLAGPKLRTGPIEPGPQVLRIRPGRDDLGRVTSPARVWVSTCLEERPAPQSADASLVVPEMWLAGLRIGGKVRLVDSRGSRRRWKVAQILETGAWLDVDKTAYLVPQTILLRERVRKEDPCSPILQAVVGPLPPLEQTLTLRPGEVLIVVRDQTPGRPAQGGDGEAASPARIGCTLPEAFDDVKPGEAVWFDDGKIGTVVEAVEETQVRLRVVQARPRGEKLRADKGINFPDTDLRLAAATLKDLEDLPFIAEHADVVELSFANTARDVEALQESLSKLGRRPAVVLKIETRRGFQNLPEMLLSAMRAPCCGIMIARGDLAVECGFERLAEVQEQILWVCEAAHVPVIWATQVLETLAKEGTPSRAEVTDAAMGNRAECVMLNKGPHVASAVRALDDILRRMDGHQDKKRSMLRELRLARALPERAPRASG